MEHMQKVMQLRRQVVEHIRANMDTFYESLVDTVSALDHLHATDVVDRIEELLTRLADTNEWGGQESISAAANILNRRIDVYCEDGDIIRFNRSATAYGTLRIAYRAAIVRRNRRGGRIDRVHYDSVVQRLRQPDPEADTRTVEGRNGEGNFTPHSNSQLPKERYRERIANNS